MVCIVSKTGRMIASNRSLFPARMPSGNPITKQRTTEDTTIARVVIASPQAFGASSPSATKLAPTTIATRLPAACHAINTKMISMITGGTALNVASIALIRSPNTSLIGWIVLRFEMAHCLMLSAASAIPRSTDENGSRMFTWFCSMALPQLCVVSVFSS